MMDALEAELLLLHALTDPESHDILCMVMKRVHGG